MISLLVIQDLAVVPMLVVLPQLGTADHLLATPDPGNRSHAQSTTEYTSNRRVKRTQLGVVFESKAKTGCTFGLNFGLVLMWTESVWMKQLVAENKRLR